ncbi:MAG: TauD/TfdA family dioxygenase [Alphaproteobacteria bacterium]|jgi:taurine dioxygenase|nr:TauD/TfdA family dioxygenase [Alphaproteobacteria bacterium]
MATSSPAAQAVTAGDSIGITPQTLHIGAEISGVDLSQPLTEGLRQQINDALLQWKVIFFRDQDLDHAGHVALARQFGQPTIGHAVFGHEDGFPEVYSIAKNRTANSHRQERLATPWVGWHTDITAAVNPPKAAILRGVTIPPYGGDTMWTNLAVAYDALSAPIKALADGLRTIHAFAPPPNASAVEAYDESVRRRTLKSEHPMVTVHPETGERLLFLSPSFVKSIVGLSPRESQTILEMLWEHLVRPEFTVRFKWNAGDIAMWDNRATAHLAPSDIYATDHDRQLYRVTLVGDIPHGVDGAPSRSLEGAPILSAEEEPAGG